MNTVDLTSLSAIANARYWVSNRSRHIGQVSVATREKTAKLLKNMPRRKPRHGVGAVCEVLLKNLHSRSIVTANFSNALASEHLDGLLCIREETKTVSHEQVMCFVFLHDLSDDVQLHCLRGWSKVKKEGSLSIPLPKIHLQNRPVKKRNREDLNCRC